MTNTPRIDFEIEDISTYMGTKPQYKYTFQVSMVELPEVKIWEFESYEIDKMEDFKKFIKSIMNSNTIKWRMKHGTEFMDAHDDYEDITYSHFLLTRCI